MLLKLTVHVDKYLGFPTTSAPILMKTLRTFYTPCATNQWLEISIYAIRQEPSMSKILTFQEMETLVQYL